MKLKKIVLKQTHVIMKESEMKQIVGGQVVSTGMCSVTNEETCSGYCAPIVETEGESLILRPQKCEKYILMGKVSCLCMPML